MKKHLYPMVVILILFTHQAFCQPNYNTYILKGTIIDEFDVPIPDAKIYLKKGSSTYSNGDGEFELRVSYDAIRINVEREGFKATTIPINNFGLESTLEIPPIVMQYYSGQTFFSASLQEESILDIPNTGIVISAEEIQQRGYISIEDVMHDLPGFDVVGVNGSTYINAYQRGYRTPFTQRTLLLVNGQVDNNLYAHTASLDRQYPMGNIKQIEVLYGPAAAVYGPNAFLGVINIITKDGKDLDRDEIQATASARGGSFNHYGADLSIVGRQEDFSYSLSGTFYSSDEADLSDRWGFASNGWYNDSLAWGPILALENNNRNFGEYYDPSNGHGFLGSLTFKNTKLEFLHWDKRNGYGAYYAADRVQNNAKWYFISSRASIEHKQEINENFTSETLLSYRYSESSGKWVEAVQDLGELTAPNDTLPDGRIVNDYSYISNTDWRTDNSSLLFRQRLFYNISEEIRFSGGFKYERKRLTRNYDIPGYFGVFGSSISNLDSGPYGLGLGVFHSSDAEYLTPPAPSNRMPAGNLVFTDDLGGFVQGIFDIDDLLRFNIGLRYDNNSIYGESWNPRGAAIWKINRNSRLKILYGEAFQEPAPILIWGGFNGRDENLELIPEKARNLEFVGMYSLKNLQAEISAFGARYENVIKESEPADELGNPQRNIGKREVIGLEGRFRFLFNTPLSSDQLVNTYLYFTYTRSLDEEFYNHDKGEWELTLGNTEHVVGDIAPIKIQAGINIPIADLFGINLRSTFHSERELYQNNALNKQNSDGEKFMLDPIFLLHGNAYLKLNNLNLSFRVNNILDNNYFHPGGEQADAGNDFENRSSGYRNSLIPQPGINFLVNATINLF